MPDILTIFTVLVASVVVATLPFDILPHHELVAASIGGVGIVWMIIAMAHELRGYRIVLKRD